MSKFPFKEIDKKWQDYWEKNETFKAYENEDFPKEKRIYILDMFPYPSSDGLHVGHPVGYVATDILSRYYRMKGFNVLHPMGFDSFGLPAETHAIKTGQHPRDNTEANIKNFKRQLKRLGFSYDWSREIATHTTEYYKWTQWIFLKLYEMGLAYTKKVPVWFCKELGTVLANEEVLSTDRGPISERGGYRVERKELKQWVLKITDYADRLLEDLELVDWPTSVKNSQINWIGKSVGNSIDFQIEGIDKKITVFTTRIDTFFGITYLVLAPEHDLIKEMIEDRHSEFIKQMEAKGLNNEIKYKIAKIIASISLKKSDSSLTQKERDELISKYDKNITTWNKEIEEKGFSSEEIEKLKTVIYYNMIKSLPKYISDFKEKKDFDEQEIEKLKQIGFINNEVLQLEKFTAPLIEYLNKTALKSDMERTELNKDKTGVFTGFYAKNPVNGKSIPIYTADYVLKDYGSGAVMAVPYQDQRDFEFAKKYNLGIKCVVHSITPSCKELYSKDSVIDFAKNFAFKLDFEIKKDKLQEVLKQVKLMDETAQNLYLCFVFLMQVRLFENKDIDSTQVLRDFIKEAKSDFHVLCPHLDLFLKSYFRANENDKRFMSSLFKQENLNYTDLEKIASYLEEEEKTRLLSAFEDYGVSVNSFESNYLFTENAHSKISLQLEKIGYARQTINYKLRDWIFSRQRYWGEPIPVYFDENGNEYLVNKEDLPLVLPEMKDGYKPNVDGESPLSNVKDWVYFQKNGKTYKRETNTMPQWAGSCWYYIRYTDPHNKNELAAEDKIDYWLPVNIYVGGREHSVLHLLYSRFWHKALYDLGIVNTPEPFVKLVNQGMITSFAYKDKDGRILPLDAVEEKNGRYFEKKTGMELEKIACKMSKSLKNVVNPDEILDEYGADALRLYEMFLGPITLSKPWDALKINGMKRFLDRVWGLLELKNEDCPNLARIYNKTIKKVEEDTKNMNYNTAISQMMVFLNEVYKENKIESKMLKGFLLVLSPYAPHITEELWNRLGELKTIAYENYPVFTEEFEVDEEVEFIIQINGKLKDKLRIKKDLSRSEVEELVFKRERVIQSLNGKEIKKTIFIEGKLINLVL